jgi:glutaredoxin
MTASTRSATPTSRRSLWVLAALVLAVSVASPLARQWQDQRTGSALAALAQPGDIVMLSSLTCTYCAQARAWFTAQQVPFSECFIERDTACAERYRALMAPGTPTLLVAGQRQVGFSAERVLQALQARSSR